MILGSQTQVCDLNKRFYRMLVYDFQFLMVKVFVSYHTRKEVIYFDYLSLF